jgi:hypothetical protein
MAQSKLQVVLVSLVVLLLAACGPPARSGPDGAVTTDPCDDGETRCVGHTYQTCQGGFFVESQNCAAQGLVCTPQLGCVQCRPNDPKVCVGDAVHACNPDGTFGEQLEVCDVEQCSNGTCGDDTCGVTGAELVYTVDDSNNLYSFDPRLLPADAFRTIGQLTCAGGTALPGFDPLQGPATPFSMSVDRNATAWVLYSSGRIFHVSTDDASCQATSFQVGQQGFELFGMGFVSETPGSQAESLYISGGPASSQGSGNLGRIDPGTLGVTSIGPLSSAEYQPELTGTGDAELYGYYPGSNTFVARLDKGTGQNAQSWQLPALTGTVRAWAFAHWGGEFYIFITTSQLFGGDYSRVLKLDPSTGMVTTALDDTGKIIVGAGVSTCAPIVVN